MVTDDGQTGDGNDPTGGEAPPRGALRLRVDEVVWREVGEDLVVLELASSTYLTLNGSAKQLWIGLTEGAGVPELVGRLTATYGITEEQATTDTEAFLAALADRKLLADD
jgi:hypothetical protein